MNSVCNYNNGQLRTVYVIQMAYLVVIAKESDKALLIG